VETGQRAQPPLHSVDGVDLSTNRPRRLGTDQSAKALGIVREIYKRQALCVPSAAKREYKSPIVAQRSSDAVASERREVDLAQRVKSLGGFDQRDVRGGFQVFALRRQVANESLCLVLRHGEILGGQSALVVAQLSSVTIRT
jgi:hypothetical protein